MNKLGSGTLEVNVASSKTNELPAGSPLMVTVEKPPAKLTSRNSLGLLAGSPEIARLLENAEAARATSVLLESKPAKVKGSKYVKYPPNDEIGESNVMEMGPPSSNTTLVPEWGGNSNSLRVTPAEMTVAFVKDKPGYWVVSEVLSAKPSKSRVMTPA
jgi:hypothetical protein